MSLTCMLRQGCPNDAALVWKRFLTDAELAQAQAANPDSDITAANSFAPVYSCIDHQISSDLAALTHQNTCTAPDTANLPSCNCTPVAVFNVAKSGA